jgi:uncharacterized protein (DUF1697 family)
MPTYVAFLRAINLGPTRKFPKAEIIAATAAAGFEGVETYINTGNVRLSSTMRSAEKVAATLEDAYAERAGFAVPTVVFSAADFAAVAADAHELTTPDLVRHYVYLLRNEPDPAQVAALEGRTDISGSIVVRRRAAHVLLGPGYEPGNVDPWSVEKALGVVATNRNFNVITTVADKWCR